MKAELLWSLAVVGVCSVLAEEEIIVDTTFDVKKFPGKWYPIITANYYQPHLERPYFAFTARVLHKRGLEINLEIPRDGTCTVNRFALQRLRIGVFRSKDKEIVIRMTDTDHNNHTIWHFKMGDTVLLQLLAKKKYVPSAWKYRFLAFANYLGFNPDNVSYLRASDLCTETPAQA